MCVCVCVCVCLCVSVCLRTITHTFTAKSHYSVYLETSYIMKQVMPKHLSYKPFHFFYQLHEIYFYFQNKKKWMKTDTFNFKSLPAFLRPTFYHYSSNAFK